MCQSIAPQTTSYGYTLENDVSVSRQRDTGTVGWVPARNHDTFAPMDPSCAKGVLPNLRAECEVHVERAVCRRENALMIHWVTGMWLRLEHLTLSAGEVLATGVLRRWMVEPAVFLGRTYRSPRRLGH